MMEKISFKNIRLFFMVFALSICTSITFAGPGDGWGLFVDIGQLKAVNENTGKEYQKSKNTPKNLEKILNTPKIHQTILKNLENLEVFLRCFHHSTFVLKSMVVLLNSMRGR